MLNLDKIIDRNNTNSWKYDFYEEYGKSKDTLSMWIADMDFETVPEVKEKMIEVAKFGVYGYSRPRASYFEALHNWYMSRFGLDIKEEYVVFTHGVVGALNLAVKTFTNEGEGVLVQRPVYYPFLNAIKNNKRQLINSPLLYKDGKYEMDFDGLEKQIVENNVKFMILCNPHNPVGRVWTKEELLKVEEITYKHGVMVCSDEIHCDFVYGNNKHTSFLTLNERAKSHGMVCTAPSKTFNLAGLQTSNIIIPNEEIRKKYQAVATSCGYEYPNIFGISACETAFRYGESWIKEVTDYIYNNYKYMVDFCKEKMPRVKIAELQGTYLPWFDMSAYGLTHEEVVEKVNNIARIWLDEGTMFGEEGKYFIRFNIACPKAIIVDAMNRLYDAFEK